MSAALEIVDAFIIPPKLYNLVFSSRHKMLSFPVMIICSQENSHFIVKKLILRELLCDGECIDFSFFRPIKHADSLSIEGLPIRDFSI